MGGADDQVSIGHGGLQIFEVGAASRISADAWAIQRVSSMSQGSGGRTRARLGTPVFFSTRAVAPMLATVAGSTRTTVTFRRQSKGQARERRWGDRDESSVGVKDSRPHADRQMGHRRLSASGRAEFGLAHFERLVYISPTRVKRLRVPDSTPLSRAGTSNAQEDFFLSPCIGTNPR